MSKCKWEDGVFIGCDKIHSNVDEVSDSRVYFKGQGIDYCPFCGADIRKPVEIKKGMLVKAKNADIWAKVVDIQSGYVVLSNGFTSDIDKVTPGLPTGFNKNGEPINE